MTKSEMLITVKNNLKLEDDTRDLDISDVILGVCDYCNLSPEDLPDDLEPFVRRKVKGVVDYEMVHGPGYTQEIASIKEGDGSITYATDSSNSRENIYGLSGADKAILRRFRRLRGYA
ncbi:hypothetical protein DXA97_18305 [Clostridium sp. OF09-36]|uniref:hypothetical protein n=1 Tax=Clostridium sp. OF09-36 TaxID=2292310 RepID=UPI000E53A7BE|nr:hypothetical protein [Clostridium sp. OF09-36]RHV84239.1 hypothetical protein DXA97_18305 [Clostridium sp. OF09-36]